jgi:hypothetical protein
VPDAQGNFKGIAVSADAWERIFAPKWERISVPKQPWCGLTREHKASKTPMQALLSASQRQAVMRMVEQMKP